MHLSTTHTLLALLLPDNHTTTYLETHDLLQLPGHRCPPDTPTLSRSTVISPAACIAHCEVVASPCRFASFEEDAGECIVYDGRCGDSSTDSRVQPVGEASSTLWVKPKRPHLGYSSWNFFRKEATQDKLLEQLDLLVSLGFRDAGYDVFHTDGYMTFADHVAVEMDGQVLEVVKRTTDNDGNLFAGSRLTDAFTTIPMGVRAYGEYIKSRGFKFSWYTPGMMDTCAGTTYRIPEFFEDWVTNDVAQYLDWGVDILKIDQCAGLKNSAQNNYRSYAKVIRLWKAAIKDDMEIENCKYACNAIRKFASDKFPDGQLSGITELEDHCTETADYFRTYIDIRPWATRIFAAAESVARFLHETGPLVGFAYGDALEVGNSDTELHGTPETPIPLGDALTWAHWGIWLVTSQPLYISTDLRVLDQAYINMLQDPRAIAINQIPGESTRTAKDGGIVVWEKIQVTDLRVIHNILVVDENETYLASTGAFDKAAYLSECPPDAQVDELWNTGAVRYRSMLVQCTVFRSTATPTLGDQKTESPAQGNPTITPTKSPVQGPVNEVSDTEAPTQGGVTEAPTTDAMTSSPAGDTSTTDTLTDAPTTDTSITNAPTFDTPTTDTPTTDTPTTDTSTTDTPTTDTPTTDTPTTDTPTTQGNRTQNNGSSATIPNHWVGIVVFFVTSQVGLLH